MPATLISGRILAGAASSSTVLNLPASFAPATNTLAGATLEALTGANAGQSKVISSNTTTTITTPAFSGAPATNDQFTIPGVLDAGSESRSPFHRRNLLLATALWTQTRSGRSRRGGLPIPPMLVPGKLVLQHTTQLGTGIVPIYQAVNAQGDSFTNAANATLQFFNNSGGPFLVNVIAQQACQQGYFHNYSMYVQPGQNLPTEIGPFDYHYSDSLGVVHITYQWGAQGIVAGVTVALVGP